MFLGSFWRENLPLYIYQEKPVSTSSYGPVFFRSSILKNQKTGPEKRSDRSPVQSSCSLFAVPKLDFQTLAAKKIFCWINFKFCVFWSRWIWCFDYVHNSVDQYPYFQTFCSHGCHSCQIRDLHFGSKYWGSVIGGSKDQKLKMTIHW